MAGVAGMLAAGALKAALGKVASAAGDRVMLQWRFSKDLEYMKDTMESIAALMEDAERRSIEEATVRLWLERVTRASDDISDLFDEFEVNSARKSALRKLKVLNPCLNLASEVRMADKMKEVRENLDKISNDRHKYSFTTSSSSNGQQIIYERATSSDVIEAKIVGRDEEKQKIMALLRRASTSSEFIVLPIYGIGGIGKTTLAQLLFNDTHFKDYKKAWVYVSQTFDLNKIEQAVRSQLQLKQGQLANTQEQNDGPCAPKSILIVLDDLWEKGDFKLDDLKDSLIKIVGNGHKVHVIVTTRDAGIAEKVQTIKAHKIQALSVDVCWTIIKKIVGFEDRSDKERLNTIGMEIAKKCGGVPLAARAIGYILRSKKDFHGWVSVKDSGIWNASSSASSTYDNVLASLILSYNSMPPDLRLCFAYCAAFPKGHSMAKDELICQWAALGFIKTSDELPTWQHGENCIKQLLEMSFFQHSESPSSNVQYGNDATLFTMHDLVHDLAISIMGDQLLDANAKCNNTGGRNCRYAFLADCSKPLNSFMTYPDRVRALHFQGSGESGHCHSGFSAAKYLRVLDLAECSLEELPSSIGQLKLLRYLNAPGIKGRVIPGCIAKLSKLIYLNLRGSRELLALPESIGGMEGLMYLDLSGCSKIKKLPESLGSLTNLVHVDFSNCPCVTDLPESLGNLTQLQYLNLSDCWRIKKLPESLGKLKSLVHVDFSGCSQVSDLPEPLGDLTQVQFLNLSGCKQLKELPKSFEKLESLVHLDLSSCSLVNGVPEVLCSQSKLQYLNLSQKPTLQGLFEAIKKLADLQYLDVSKCIEMPSRYFDDLCDSVSTLSNLEHLDLSNNHGLKTIPESICSLRKLHTLDLTGCVCLRRLPENMGRMDSLKFLIVNNCSYLDKSTLPINKSLIPLPNFVVHATEDEQRSSLILLKDVNPPELEISRLENVTSVEEAQIIELRGKQSMVKLTLDWTRGTKGFVEDMELLKKLLPPRNLEMFEIRGYNSVTFPSWLMRVDIHLPNLVRVELKGLSRCSSLPPLGQLPNLEKLHLEAMPSLTKIDRGFCGHGVKAFTQLKELTISNMESLKEWSAEYTAGEGFASEFMFPNLWFLKITECRKLRVGPCPPRVKEAWTIGCSDGVLLQWGEIASHNVCSTSSALVQKLSIESCRAPMHQWKLLHHLPTLNELVIENCSDLRSSPEITRVLGSLRSLSLFSCRGVQELRWWLGGLTSLQSLELSNCSGIQALPEELGHCVSLKKLSIINCEGIMSFPESIQQLTNLERLTLSGCPLLNRWYEKNKTNIGHIKQMKFYD